MNRQIKFRAKILNSDQWIYGYYYYNTPTHEHRIISQVEKSDEMLGWNVDPETIGQFTGLTDKNGTEIYEGDIMIIQDTDYNLPEKVIFDDGCFKADDGRYKYDFSTIDTKYRVVIGNIYENPIEE